MAEGEQGGTPYSAARPPAGCADRHREGRGERRAPRLGGAAAGGRQDAGRAGDRAAPRPHHRRAGPEHRDPVAVAPRLGRVGGEPGAGTREVEAAVHGADLPVAGHLRGPRHRRGPGRRRRRCWTRCTRTAARSSSGSRRSATSRWSSTSATTCWRSGAGCSQELLDELPDAFVLGLTATPPSTLTQEQKALVDELFGDAAVQRRASRRWSARGTWRRSPSSPG